MYTITIPVKPYVKKFINARYRQEVWELNKQERIGKVIYSMLERMPKRYEKYNLKLGDELTISICHDNAVRKGCYLSTSSIVEFNDFIQMELIEAIAMYQWQVKNKQGLKKYRELYVRHNRAKSSRITVVQDPDLYQYLEKREIIYDFLKLYNISEDDLPFETVKKALHRFKLPLLIA